MVNRPAESVNEAIAIVRAYEGAAKDFKLSISESLLDEMGLNMSIIGDALIEKGFAPDGFEQRDGYRVYAYQDFGDI